MKTIRDLGYKYEHEFKTKCAKIIDDSWYYSMHWGKNPEERHWTMDAKHDCIARIQHLETELNELKRLRTELEDVCLFYVPEEQSK